MLIAGLTGSIAMGKSTVADMIAACGIPMISADQIVHDLYDGPIAADIEAAFPGSTKPNDSSGEHKLSVDRQALIKYLNGQPELFKKLEAIIHPLVRKEEWAFIERQKRLGAELILIEIPLLFETGAEALMDMVILASATSEDQRRRALARPGMTEEKLDLIRKKQLPDHIKREKADLIINTSLSLEETDEEVKNAIIDMRSRAQQMASKPDIKDSAYQRWAAEMANLTE